MRHLDLFSGIGGFAYAVDQVWDNAEHIFCDNDLFCQKVLKKHWPESTIYGNIREISQPIECNILTGGFPCQPFSHAGKRRGTTDDRHLWPEMFRVIQLTKPTWVIAENVRGLLSIEGGLVFEQVCTDLEDEGYEVQPIVIPACAVSAPHRRDRVWIIAYPTNNGFYGSQDTESGIEGDDSDQTRADELLKSERGNPLWSEAPDWGRDWFKVAAELCRVDDGIPPRLDRNKRIKALGNAIVPQVVIPLLKAIKQTTNFTY